MELAYSTVAWKKLYNTMRAFDTEQQEVWPIVQHLH